MSGDVGKSAWVKRVLGIELGAADPGAFEDLDELGIGVLDIWQAARASFDTANESVDAQITALVAALRASDDAEMQQIGDMGLNGLTGNVKVPLIAALTEAGTHDMKTVAAARPKVLAAIAAFRSKITSDPAIEALDGNPLDVDVDIVGTFETALEELEDALVLA